MPSETRKEGYQKDRFWLSSSSERKGGTRGKKENAFMGMGGPLKLKGRAQDNRSRGHCRAENRAKVGPSGDKPEERAVRVVSHPSEAGGKGTMRNRVRKA